MRPTRYHLGEAYGLLISSDLGLLDPVDHAGDGVPDVVISSGVIEPCSADDPPDLVNFVRRDGDRLWINIPGKLAMRIEAGERIVYQPHANAIEDEMRLYLLGTGLAAILMQRGHFVLHGNAIAMPCGNAIVCMGSSGAGKSTIAAALMARGYAVLSDDVCAIDKDGNILRGLTRVKLWDDAARKIGIDTTGLRRFEGAHDKWSVPLSRSLPPVSQRAGLFVHLEVGDSAALEESRFSGAERFAALCNNIFRPELSRVLELDADYMQRLAQLAVATPIHRIRRPASCLSVDTVAEAILALHSGQSLVQHAWS